MIPPPPRKPDDLECCHRGCDPCIFDYYWRALDRWRDTVTGLGLDPDRVLSEGDGVRPVARS